MALWIRGMECCGVKEISGLSQYHTRVTGKKPSQAMQDFVASYSNERGREPREFNFTKVVFTEAKAPGSDMAWPEYGSDFATYIIEHKLGKVHQEEPSVNPNTGNEIKVWIWTLNRANLQDWWDKNQPPPVPAVVAVKKATPTTVALDNIFRRQIEAYWGGGLNAVNDRANARREDTARLPQVYQPMPYQHAFLGEPAGNTAGHFGLEDDD